MAAWKVVKLSEVCEIQRGGSPRPIENFITEADDGINWIKIGDVAEGAKYITSTKEKIMPEGAQRSRAVQEGDFLLSNSMSFGRPYILRTSGCIHDGWLVLRYDKNQLTEDYLYHVLGSDFVYAQFEKFAVGAVVKNLNSEVVRQVSIPLPPLDEQHRIAAILDQADALRAKRREALAQLDSLTQSIFIEMFGGAQTIYERWPVKPLGEMLEFLTSGSRGWAEYYAETGAIFLRIQNICRDLLDLNDVAYVSAPDSAEARRTEVRGGDVLLSITADLGRTAVVPFNIGKAHINQHLSILRTTAVMPRYLSAFLASPAGQREVMGRNKQGVKAGLNFDDIRSFRIPMPPRNLQQEFVARAEDVGRQLLVHYQSANELDSLFASLQHRAFRGEL